MVGEIDENQLVTTWTSSASSTPQGYKVDEVYEVNEIDGISKVNGVSEVNEVGEGDLGSARLTWSAWSTKVASSTRPPS